jgi:hypothetical protein
VLQHHGHLARVAVCQPIGELGIGVRGVEGDEKMMAARQAGIGHALQHGLDQTAHCRVHQISIVDVARHVVSPNKVMSA